MITYPIETPLGTMIAASHKQGICLLEYEKCMDNQKRLQGDLITGKSPHIHKLEKELKEYFRGERKTFDVPLYLSGTQFQIAVWKMLMTIPYGETRSYKEQAEYVEKPQAVRAVARANGANRIAIVIPCHRVIGSDGSLTGYGGGIERKRFLLNLESLPL